MFASIAGAITIGDFVANTEVRRALSLNPLASLAMVLALAGAITNMSACSANATWFTASSELMSNILVTTCRWVMLLKLRGVTNLVAESVRITSTSAPACVN